MSSKCNEISALRRVLLAYAIRNPEIGYCQSMNFIAALLLYHLSEENTFWVLASLLEDILPRDYYSSSMVGARVDQQVFQSCIQWKMPRLHEHLQNMNTVLEPVCYPWFLCLYVNILPVYTVCRIWDCLFHEGNVILFKVALGMLKCKEEKILQCTNTMSIYMLLRSDNTANENYELEQSAPGSSETYSVHSLLLFESFSIIKSVPRNRFTSLTAHSSSLELTYTRPRIDALREAFTEILEKADADEDSRSVQDLVSVVSIAPVTAVVPKSAGNRRTSIHNTVSYQTASNGEEKMENLMSSAKYINENQNIIGDIERIKNQGL